METVWREMGGKSDNVVAAGFLPGLHWLSAKDKLTAGGLPVCFA